MNNMKVGVMITFYCPCLKGIGTQIESILPHVAHICVVDNSLPELAKQHEAIVSGYSRVHYIALNRNEGIARAQNIGAQYLFQMVDAIIFLDQDSLPAPQMISRLISTHYRLMSFRRYKIGAIGPQAINNNTHQAYRAKIKKGISLAEDEAILKVTEIISSGSLITKESWELTGGMEEALFIDAVDHEWCWRGAQKGGLSYFIDQEAELYHALGEGDKKLIGPFKLTGIPKPIRCYYLYRNYLLLSTRKYVPVYWKLMNFLKLSAKLFFYPVFLPSRKQYLKYMLRGLKDGFSRRGGIYSEF